MITEQKTQRVFSPPEHWLQAAEADYRLCRAFARHHTARLTRSGSSHRVGWEAYGHVHCALLLPDALQSGGPTDDEWYLYYVSGESLFRRTRTQRAQMDMILLAESADDWAELLRQAWREDVFDVRYEVTPDYLNVLGETELARSGFVFTLEACAPPAARMSAPCRVVGNGATPAGAARDACRRWLQEWEPDVEFEP